MLPLMVVGVKWVYVVNYKLQVTYYIKVSNFDSVFVFKQRTAYEMRISDWSSDVCSSDFRRRRGWAWRSAGRGWRGGRAAPARFPCCPATPPTRRAAR